MRSAFYQRPLEFQIQTDVEEWSQGNVIEGVLRVRNNGTAPETLAEAKLILAYGLRKAVKKADPGAWSVLEEQSLLIQQTLDVQEEQTVSWSFSLPTDCPVTDKSGSLFLLFGGPEALREGGRIDLRVYMHSILQSFLLTFTTQFQFLEKYRKAKGEWTEVKLDPPDSKEFPNLDHLLCNLRIRDERLETLYRFKMKSFGREGESVKVVSRKREFEQQFPASDYLQPGGYPNRQFFRKVIGEALDQARQKVAF